MELIDLTHQEYYRTFPSPQHVYNSARFIECNSHKVSRVRYLCVADTKPRLGLIVGAGTDGRLRAPFSAPFSGFDFNRRQSVATLLEAAELMRRELPGLRLTLPPPVYEADDMNFRTQCAFLTSGASIAADWNFHIPLTGNYPSSLSSDSRKKLNKALRSPFRLTRVDEDPARAYEVIRTNRAQHDYPLRMTLDDVLSTTRGPEPIVEADFFVLTDGTADAAAAMVYRVTSEVAQVIYWGDDKRVDACPFPVNLLALELVKFYSERGFEVLDIGPSSTDGVPSVSLCKFKDSIGCSVTPKPIITL